ncbi:MAG: Maf family protein [Dehalococcoidia bacterium]|nr:Maf family protein [Dehalococcoidia bacterium]MDD5493997.1 Maf family protein [Dehalococcoidia bacterium]
MKPVILASASPRRRELLENIGLKFSVDPVETDEGLDRDVEPRKLAKLISREKAVAAAARHRDAVIIAADTFGVMRGKLLGKPVNRAEAREMLKLLSGKSHTVITGFTIMDSGSGRTCSRAVTTRVSFRKLSEAEIDTYVRSGEPMGKAAGYAIQGLGSLLVEGIEGDYFNVMGLPVGALAAELKKFGIEVLR